MVQSPFLTSETFNNTSNNNNSNNNYNLSISHAVDMVSPFYNSDYSYHLHQADDNCNNSNVNNNICVKQQQQEQSFDYSCIQPFINEKLAAAFVAKFYQPYVSTTSPLSSCSSSSSPIIPPSSSLSSTINSYPATTTISTATTGDANTDANVIDNISNNVVDFDLIINSGNLQSTQQNDISVTVATDASAIYGLNDSALYNPYITLDHPNALSNIDLLQFNTQLDQQKLNVNINNNNSNDSNNNNDTIDNRSNISDNNNNNKNTNRNSSNGNNNNRTKPILTPLNVATMPSYSAANPDDFYNYNEMPTSTTTNDSCDLTFGDNNSTRTPSPVPNTVPSSPLYFSTLTDHFNQKINEENHLNNINHQLINDGLTYIPTLSPYRGLPNYENNNTTSVATTTTNTGIDTNSNYNYNNNNNTIYNVLKIENDTQTIPPSAINISQNHHLHPNNQPAFAPIFTNSPTEASLKFDYFTTPHIPSSSAHSYYIKSSPSSFDQQHPNQYSSNQNNNFNASEYCNPNSISTTSSLPSSPYNTTTTDIIANVTNCSPVVAFTDDQKNNKRRRSKCRTLSNPPCLKSQPLTPVLSSDSHATFTTTSPSSPTSPSLSIVQSIKEEEDDNRISRNNGNNTNNLNKRKRIGNDFIKSKKLINAAKAEPENNNNLNGMATNGNNNNAAALSPITTVPTSKSAAATHRHHHHHHQHQNSITDNVMRPNNVHQYSSTSGEKKVMILTSKVAQKSYGTEKRFLCPPPTTIILGSNWWCPSHNNNNNNTLSASPTNTNNTTTTTSFSTPKITVGISGEQTNQQGILEWISPSGNSLDPTSTCSEMNFSGKCVSKHLYISDADEKRKKVEVLVNIQSPMGDNIGTFASKPIKVISKPSKKRQSAKNMELCIHHGSTVSLFNRIRSQTVSTKYLGVSTQQNANQTSSSCNYPNGNSGINNNNNNNKDNNMLNNNNNNNNNGESQSIQPPQQPCFVARTGSWDPFIIWIVDPNYTKGKDDNHHHHHNNHNNNNQQQVFPRPPPSALKSDPNAPIPIHYNQPVVLQCLTTGMTSPVMIIRKVDKGSMVVGGGIVDNNEEAIGDPVSQLHKVAFQIKDATLSAAAVTTTAATTTTTTTSSIYPSGPGTYLACLGDVVGMQRANDGRQIIIPTTSTPTPTPTSASTTINDISPPAWSGAAADVLTENIKVGRKRRVSSPAAVMRPSSTNSNKRRRVNSLSGVASEVDLARLASNTNKNSGALWTEDVTDAAVWTIVGTDCATYTF